MALHRFKNFVKQLGSVAVLMCFWGAAASAEKKIPVVRYMPNHPYYHELIHAAMEASKQKDNDYQLAPATRSIPVMRVHQETRTGRLLNVFWGPAIADLMESDIIPIPIPTVRGLIGFRILLVNKLDQKSIQGIIQKQDWPVFSLGQPFGWIDTRIYRDNQLKVTEANGFNSVLAMLDAGRIHAFPIGADEVHILLNRFQGQYPDLEIENSFAFYYPLPFFLYVSKTTPEIARRLEAGMEKLIASGEMQILFNKFYGERLAQLQLDKREIYVLENKYLADKLPFDRKELWHPQIPGIKKRLSAALKD